MCTRTLRTVFACAVAVSTAFSQTPARATQRVDSSLKPVTFKEGTLAQYVDHVREVFPAANIHIDRNTPKVRVHDVQLKKVPVAGALEWVLRTEEAKDSGLTLQPSVGGKDTDVFVFSRSASAAARAQAGVDRHVKSYSIPKYLSENEGAELRQAIADDLSELRQAGPKPEVKHLKTRIQVIGPREAILAADRIYDEVVATRRVAAMIQDLQKQVETIKSDVETLKKAQARPAQKETTNRD